MIRIDKGIPIPPPAVTQKYPLRTMEIGDSFYVPDTRARGMCRHGLYNSAKRAGIRVTVRKVEGGVRVWRSQ